MFFDLPLEQGKTCLSGRALFSAGLMDEICPPSTFLAAYNQYGGEKVRSLPGSWGATVRKRSGP